MKKFVAHIIFLCLLSTATAQNIPVRDPHYIRDIQKNSLRTDLKGHSSILPVYFNEKTDSMLYEGQYEQSFLYYGWKSKNKEKQKSFYALPVYEVFNWFGFQEIQEYMYNIHLGGLFDYAVGDKFGISYQLSAWRLDLPTYQRFQNANFNVYPGLGMVHRSIGNVIIENDIHINWSPYKFLRLELARGKNFYGDGYRSFMLSDFASAYPYFKLETSFLSVKYSCVWAYHRSYLESEYQQFPGDEYLIRVNKFDVFHYLDWKIGKRFNLGLFEAIITRDRNFFTFEYMNPIIFFRPVEFNLGSEDNALLGTNMRLSLNDRNAIYGQFVLDDIIVGQLLNDIRHTVNQDYTGEYGWFANKWAAQLGFKSYDIFKLTNLDFFTEINIARPYTYSHVHPEQNYSHALQPLAHPLGANFVESVSGVSYLGKRILIDAKIMYAIVGADTTGSHFGQNIFNPTMDGNQGYTYIVNSYGNVILQGIKTEAITAKLDFGYILCKNKNLSLNAGVIFRSVKPEIQERRNYTYIFFGIKSNFVKREMIF